MFIVLYSLLCGSSKLNLRNKVTIFKTVIRPIMTYAAPAWSMVSNNQLPRIQRMQNKVLRSVTRAPWFMRNSRIHQDLQIPSIAEFMDVQSIKYYERLPEHPNPTMAQLTRLGAPRKYRRPQDILLATGPRTSI